MSWESFESKVERGPTSAILGCVGILIVLLLAGTGISWFFGTLWATGHTVRDQFGLDASIRKYESFKTMAAELSAKKASIETMEQSLKKIRDDYKGVAKNNWPRDERETFNQRQAELLGLKMSFNSLAAEYNAAMAKINWAYANVGSLPRGTDQVLPGQGAFAPYLEQ